MTPDQIRYSNEYWKQRFFLTFLEKKVYDFLEALCQQNSVRVESRVKDEKSFLDKIDRPGKSYKDPINDITDLVGFRVITYYKRDVDIVEEIIRKNFCVDDTHTQDTFERLQPNEFGYLSKHFIVQLSPETLKQLSPERYRIPDFNHLMRECKEQKFEIQVRTLLQHAWATLSHKLTYKAENEAPRELRRKIAMLSALLETADDASMSLQKLRQEIQEKYRNEITAGNLNGIFIDAESVSAYLELSDDAKAWWTIAHEIGWQSLIPIQVNLNAIDGIGPEDVEAERKEKEKERQKRQVSNLIALLGKGKVEKLSELDEILTNDKPLRIKYLRDLFMQLQANNEHVRASIHDIIRAIVINVKCQVIRPSDLKALDYDESLINIFSKLCNLCEKDNDV
ncbi:hypothetical protein IC229_21380 [Spirosoma sp. BT702]|uniref:RelA/SpoT domain-containing protein n=1 Tax=Spirosoma profusum TaxID=2771354 RepID=A0A927AS28_9BACT|nr:hypothetical protein [Spirosoma profusum]MBD2703211.1 hypothetical protein [Spirosoma profusum]